MLAPVRFEYPSPTSRGGAPRNRRPGRDQGGAEALRARSSAFARPVAQGQPRRARPRCAVPPPCPLRRVRRAPARRLPRIAWSGLGSPRLSPVRPYCCSPRAGKPGPPRGRGRRDGTRSPPAPVKAPCGTGGGDARRGGLDRRVGGLPSPPPPRQRAFDLRRCIRPGGGLCR